MPKKPSADEIKPVDQLTEAQIDELHADTLEELEILRSRWRGLVQLSDKERGAHVGKSLVMLTPALSALFTAMLPNKRDDAKQAEKRAAFAKSFDAYGDKDAGEDPERFEADLLLRRMHRVKAQQEIADKLTEFGRLLGDDVLHTSEMVLIPGQHALDMGRSLENSAYGSFLVPVFDALRSLTKAARARLTQLRAEAAAAPVAPAASGDATEKTP